MDRTNNRLSVGLLAVAFADDADPYADYIYLTKDDTTSKYSWNNTDAVTFKQGNWSEPFSTERNYYVSAGRTLYADGRNGAAGIWAGMGILASLAGDVVKGVLAPWTKVKALCAAALRVWWWVGCFPSGFRPSATSIP